MTIKKSFSTVAILAVTLIYASACSYTLSDNEPSSSQVSSGDNPHMTSTEKFKCRSKITHVARNRKDCASDSKYKATGNEISDASSKIQPYQIAGSDTRKSFCRHKRTHTQQDYFDCVAGRKKWGHAVSYHEGVVQNDNK